MQPLTTVLCKGGGSFALLVMQVRAAQGTGSISGSLGGLKTWQSHTTSMPMETPRGSSAPCFWNSAPRVPATMTWVTNIQTDAMISSLRRPTLSKNATATKVASTLTSQRCPCHDCIPSPRLPCSSARNPPRCSSLPLSRLMAPNDVHAGFSASCLRAGGIHSAQICIRVPLEQSTVA